MHRYRRYICNQLQINACKYIRKEGSGIHCGFRKTKIHAGIVAAALFGLLGPAISGFPARQPNTRGCGVTPPDGY